MKKPVILLLSFVLALNVALANEVTSKKINYGEQLIYVIGGTSTTILLLLILGSATNESGVLGMSPPKEHPSTIPNVRVFKVFNPSNETVQGLLAHLEHFDSWMTGLGVETPPATKFFISGPRILPSFLGGYVRPSSSSQGGGLVYNIVTANLVPFTESDTRNLHTLFHERTHTFLFHHSGGSRRLYTSGYAFMKEGLADFFPHLYFRQYHEKTSDPFHYTTHHDITRPLLFFEKMLFGWPLIVPAMMPPFFYPIFSGE